MMIVVVSGKTFYAALDPNATAVPKEEGWPEPQYRKVGKGAQYTYNLTADQRREMLSHLRQIGETFAEGDDDYTRAEGRAILRDVRRIEAEKTT